MNFFGRKKTMLMFIVPFLIGWALIIWAQNLAMLIVGRVFLGITAGGFCVVAPMLVYEFKKINIINNLFKSFQGTLEKLLKKI